MSGNVMQFEALAVKQASSRDVRSLFERLAAKKGNLQQLHECRAFRMTERQRLVLSEFQRDAEESASELAARVAQMSDATLLNIALRSSDSKWNSKKRSYAAFREEDQVPQTKSCLSGWRRLASSGISLSIQNSRIRFQQTSRPQRAASRKQRI